MTWLRMGEERNTGFEFHIPGLQQLIRLCNKSHDLLNTAKVHSVCQFLRNTNGDTELKHRLGAQQ